MSLQLALFTLSLFLLCACINLLCHSDPEGDWQVLFVVLFTITIGIALILAALTIVHF